MSTHNELAMIAAHQRGRNLARDGVSRETVNALAAAYAVDEGDALLAGYYAELRRMNKEAQS